MKIEAVTTCVNYGDFLAETLPTNRYVFSRFVVVTAPEDLVTRKLCEFWHVQCVLTDAFESRWGRFNKAAGINAGLATLDKDAWLVHLDADIFLPPLTRDILDVLPLDEQCIYGVDRYRVLGFPAWRQFCHHPRLQHEAEYFVHMDSFPLGTRACSGEGYAPVGFFQLWHSRTGCVTYPVEHTTAARTDTLHALQWPREYRRLIPEFVAYHLESELAPMGANWNGRTTKAFQFSDGTQHHSGVS
jgi:hypothetical protein